MARAVARRGHGQSQRASEARVLSQLCCSSIIIIIIIDGRRSTTTTTTICATA